MCEVIICLWTLFIFLAGYKLGNVFGDNTYKKEWIKK